MSEQATSTQKTGNDNLMGMLTQFNDGSLESVVESETEEQEVQNPESKETEEKTQEVSAEEQTAKEEKAVEEVRKWLIDNKFEDTQDGREKLADAYKNIQSAKDKAESELKQKSNHYEKLEVLDKWLNENPKLIEMLQQEAQKQEADGPPVKPEDYDITEEQIDGSESQKWRIEYDQWLIDQGAKKAMNQFEGIRKEETKVKQRQAEVNELKSLGMSDEEIQSCYGFMNAPENVTTKNMVKVWKVLNDKQEDANTASKDVKDNKVLKMEKVQSGAAVEGQAPPVKKPADKELDEFMKGIMQFSKK